MKDTKSINTEIKDNMLSHATKSAAIAIMVRNNSHNIGSHILTRAKIENIVHRISELLEKNNILETNNNLLLSD